MGCATAVFWNNVVNGQIAELEGCVPAIAPALLLPEQDVLVLPIEDRRVGFYGGTPPRR